MIEDHYEDRCTISKAFRSIQKNFWYADREFSSGVPRKFWSQMKAKQTAKEMTRPIIVNGDSPLVKLLFFGEIEILVSTSSRSARGSLNNFELELINHRASIWSCKGKRNQTSGGDPWSVLSESTWKLLKFISACSSIAKCRRDGFTGHDSYVTTASVSDLVLRVGWFWRLLKILNYLK